jgi:hypothetical protein
MAKSASIAALAIAAMIAAAIGVSVASAQHAPGDAAAAAQRAPLGGNQATNPAAQNFSPNTRSAAASTSIRTICRRRNLGRS